MAAPGIGDGCGVARDPAVENALAQPRSAETMSPFTIRGGSGGRDQARDGTRCDGCGRGPRSRMAGGVPILETVTKECKIEALDKTTFRIILTQGLNRQIRRMCEHFGYRVIELKRVRIMNINLGRLKVGGFRNVTEREIAGLSELIKGSSSEPIEYDNQ